MFRRALLSVLLALALLAPMAAWAQFPSLPGIPKLPSGGGGRKSKGPWFTTNLASAKTDVPFLDRYDPAVLVPMAEMPRGPRGDFLLAPGAYDFFAESYCLHAGTHGPGGKGNGYLFAPAEGPGAKAVTMILRNSALHPEIPQRDIQLLLWALLSETPFHQISPPLQQVGRTLLDGPTLEELSKNPPSSEGGGDVDVLGSLTGYLPSQVQRVLNAQSEIRGLLSRAVPNYAEVERIAVLSGEARREKNDRDVPAGRWSFNPKGFFVAFFPEGYQSTLQEVFVPGNCRVETDASGRIVRVRSADGSTVEAEYEDAPLTLSGEDGVQGWTLKALHLSQAVRWAPGSPYTASLPVRAPVLTGLPRGDGAVSGPLADQHRFALEHRRQVEALLEATGTKKGASDPALVTRLVNLACFTKAVCDLVDPSADPAVLPTMANPGYEAWMTVLADSRRVAGLEGAVACTGPWADLGADPSPGYLAASGGVGLGWFDSSDGVGQPGRQGSQRLGQSSRPSKNNKSKPPKRNPKDKKPPKEDPDDEDPPEDWKNKDILSKASECMDGIEKFVDVVTFADNPADFVAGKLSGAPGDGLKGAYFDWVFSTTATISRELGGDPPRPDFDQVAEPRPVDPKLLFPDLKKPLAADGLAMSVLELNSVLLAARITRDRLGGAVEAGDAAGIERQGEALIRQKRLAGLAWIKTATALERAAGRLSKVKPAQLGKFRAAVEKAARAGVTPQVRKIALGLGMTDEQIEEAARRRSEAPEAAPLVDPQQVLEAARACRDLGRMWAALPQP